jgi:hypothetical protein
MLKTRVPRTVLTEGKIGSPRCSPSTPGLTPPTILVPHSRDSLTLAVACLPAGEVSREVQIVQFHSIDLTSKPLEQNPGMSSNLQVVQSIRVASTARRSRELPGPQPSPGHASWQKVQSHREVNGSYSCGTLWISARTTNWPLIVFLYVSSRCLGGGF